MASMRCLLLAALLLYVSPAEAQSPPAGPPVSPLLVRARQFNGQSRFAEALAAADSLLAGEPDNGGALMARGFALSSLGRSAEAAVALERAVELQPALMPRAASLLFGAYARLGRRDDAYRWFERIRQSGRVDLSGIAAGPGVEGLDSLRGDPRFSLLLPDSATLAHPFVEPGVRILHEWRGEARGDEFGWIARGIGDVDGDRVTDVVVSATQNAPYGAQFGIVYLYSGRSGRLLWKHRGDSTALLGTGLEAAGDVNGDRIPDVVAGAPGINAVLVLSGRDGRELLRLRGDSTERGLGSAAAGVGDVDGDGRPDIVAGAPGTNGAAGRVVVFSGRDGHRLMVLDGERPGDGFGSTVGGGGGTIIVGAVGGGAGNRGSIYVYHGTDRRPVFVRQADTTGVALGNMFVSVLGDVNGDGTPDIYASDFGDAARGPATGRVYVYSGTTGEVLLDIPGETPGAAFGIGAARTGDVDGDGRADLVVGSWQYSGAAWSGGRVQVLSGRDGRVLQTFTGAVPGETLGFDAVGIGDVDGDGVTDYLLTSAWSLVNGARSGRTWVVAGRRP